MCVITGKYKIYDCENQGDIQSAVEILRNIGCRVCNSYWDGKDCGEAYISIEVAEKDFVGIYRQICHTTDFDADINDYIKFDNKTNYKYIGVKTLVSLYKAKSNVITDGFEKKQLYLLYIENKEKDLDLEKVINTLVYEYGFKTEVLCYSCDMEDGSWCFRVLVEMECGVEVFGTLKLLTSMTFRRFGLRGSLHQTHSLRHYNNEIYKERVKNVVNKEELEYHNTRYDKKKYPYSEYAINFNGEVFLKTEFYVGNDKFYL